MHAGQVEVAAPAAVTELGVILAGEGVVVAVKDGDHETWQTVAMAAQTTVNSSVGPPAPRTPAPRPAPPRRSQL